VASERSNGYTPFDLAAWLARVNADVRAPKPWQDGGQIWIFNVCPFDAGHVGTSSSVGQHGSGTLFFKCQHDGCADKRWKELRQLLDPEWKFATDAGDSSAATGDDEVPLPVVLEAVPDFPVDVLPAEGQALVMESTLPAAYLAAFELGGLGHSLGGNVEIRVASSFVERVVLFVPAIGPRGSGKTPSRRMVLEGMRARDRAKRREYREARREWQRMSRQERNAHPELRPENTSRLGSDTTMEALYRRLARASDVGLDLDELAKLLEGLGQYHQEHSLGRRDNDLDRLLELWASPDDATYERVGSSGTEDNAVELYIDKPTLTIFGSLQTSRHMLLGDEESGARPRWLPHLGLPVKPRRMRTPGPATRDAWDKLLQRLSDRRDIKRVWVLDGAVLDRFLDLKLAWDQRAAGEDVSPTVSGALDKASTHVVRIAAVLAEAALEGLPAWVINTPALELPLPDWALGQAAVWVDYTVDCWAALGGQTTFSLTPKDRLADGVVDAFVAYIESHGHVVQRDGVQRLRVSRNDLLQMNVGGVRTRDDRNVVLKRYEQRYPLDVEQDTVGAPGGGPKPMWVYAPRRHEKPATVGSRARAYPRANLHTSQTPQQEPDEVDFEFNSSSNGRVEQADTAAEATPANFDFTPANPDCTPANFDFTPANPSGAPPITPENGVIGGDVEEASATSKKKSPAQTKKTSKPPYAGFGDL
jgi:hypothetical protein